MPQGIRRSPQALEGKKQTIQRIHSYQVLQGALVTMGLISYGHQQGALHSGNKRTQGSWTCVTQPTQLAICTDSVQPHVHSCTSTASGRLTISHGTEILRRGVML